MSKRRLFSGILLIALSYWEVFMGYFFYQQKLYDVSVDLDPAKDGIMSWFYFLFGLAASACGMAYISTHHKRPVKWAEYTMIGITVVIFLAAAISGAEGGILGAILGFTSLFHVYFFALGIATK